MSRSYFVYILASRMRGTLYIGMTNNLARRIWEHKKGEAPGFTKKYDVKRLVYFEALDDPTSAIQREKTMKKWPRAWKIKTIEQHNPEWEDLYETLSH